MNETILGSIKKMLGDEQLMNPAFDNDIVPHINGVLMHLNQLGVGPAVPYYLTSSNFLTATWADFLGSDYHNFEAVKTFVFLRVRLLFDPPTVGSVLTSMENLAKEYEWRLTVQATK